MEMRRCTCGAEVDVRRSMRCTADGCKEIVYRVNCPVCRQLGPAVPAEDMDEVIAIADATHIWNERLKPSPYGLSIKGARSIDVTL